MIASGPETLAFENEFAEFVGCEFACAVNNGTSALSLALSASGIGPGDEVITSPLTFVATANAILGLRSNASIRRYRIRYIQSIS